MILSNRYNFLYVHIAKTGGTSVRAALRKLQWKDPYYLAQFVCSRLSHLTGHRIAAKLPRHAKIVCAQEMLPKDFFDGLFKFAFVRNPWDWQVSCYHHLLRDRPELLAATPDFGAYLRAKLADHAPRQIKLDATRFPQRQFVVDLQGQPIVDFVGHFERLREDTETVFRRLGLPAPPLPHKRRSQRERDYRGYYDDALAALVAEKFRVDIDSFGYRFDPET